MWGLQTKPGDLNHMDVRAGEPPEHYKGDLAGMNRLLFVLMSEKHLWEYVNTRHATWKCRILKNVSTIQSLSPKDEATMCGCHKN